MANRQCFMFVSVLFIGLLLHCVVGDKIGKKIYKDIKAIKGCVLLTNATHQIGCRSSLGGHVGVIHFVKSDEDIQWHLSDKQNMLHIYLYSQLTLLKNLLMVTIVLDFTNVELATTTIMWTASHTRSSW